MHAVNLFDKSVKISSKIRLDFFINFDKTEIYLIELKAAEVACIDQDNLSYFNQDNLQLVNSIHSETVLSNSITVYDNEQIIKTLSKIINCHNI